MIVVKITGGLGNQLFQYAAAKALARKHKTSVGISLASYAGNYRENHFRRNFYLDKFHLKFIKIGEKVLRRYMFTIGCKQFDDYIISKMTFLHKKLWYDLGTIESFNKIPPDICLIGYFQNPQYFKSIESILKKEIVLKNRSNIQDLFKKINKEKSISIHVRRGDLLKFNDTQILTKKYYQKALSIIHQKIKNPTFYIFSDDIDWCKSNFDRLENKTFVEDTTVAEDLELMKNCKHNILANSTLSWWAAYLNQNKNKIIIQPKNMNLSKNKKEKYLLFDDAIKIK